MTRFEKRILFALGLLILGLSILEAMAPKPTDWTPSYSRYHRKPFGGLYVFERLKDLFPEVRTISDPLYSTSRERHASQVDQEAVNHIFVNSHFSPDVISTDRLLSWVAAGDNAFIASDDIRGPIADSLNLGMRVKPWYGEDDVSDIRFIGDPRIADGAFRFGRGFTGAYFTSYDTSRTRSLAVDGSSHPVLLEMVWGKGRIVLCSAPMAITNYNLVKDRNATFIAGALSVLPPIPVFWDESYKVGRMEAQTPLRYILSQTPLSWAWFLSLALVVLYIFVHARRQQRAVPVVAPPRNATRDLMHTVGRLYWHKRDHTDLARKMIAHFKEDVRQRTYLRTFAYDPATIDHLATKTGLSNEEAGRRLNAIAQRERTDRITESDLLELSNELHEFRQLIR
ncbi:MAG: hypothetical protein JNL43_01780 [Flavobacteriales bacterium]|nr:hypothetical protein [Flavobacteriales bacterium]